jgi:hypothetical protein
VLSSGSKKRKAAHFQTDIVRLMLSMCAYLRLCDIPTNDAKNASFEKATFEKATVWENNFWFLNLNYLHLAKAALDCFDYFAVILYCDIWCQRTLE